MTNTVTAYQRAANLSIGQYTAASLTLTDKDTIPLQLLADGSLRVGLTSGTITIASLAPFQTTPVAGTVSVVTTGGTAVTVATGPLNGGFIVNPYNTAAQNVTAENLYVDIVGTPGSTDANGNGTTTILFPGQSYSIPAIVTGKTVKVNAATSGHKFTVVIL